MCAELLGRVLGAELMLGLAIQRGSLQFLLEWVKMALTCCETEKELRLTKNTVLFTLSIIRRCPVEVVEKEFEQLTQTELDLYFVANLIIKEVGSYRISNIF